MVRTYLYIINIHIHINNMKYILCLKLEILTKLNLWLINSQLDSEFLEMFIKPDYLLKSCIVVILDLTKVRKYS